MDDILEEDPSRVVFFFIRDPVARFVSGFNSRLRQGQPRYNSPWRPSEKKAFKAFPTANALAEAMTGPDQDRAIKAMDAIGHLKQPMGVQLRSIEVLERYRSRIVFIGEQECLAADFETLKRVLGLPSDLSVPDDDVVAHRAPAGTCRALSARAIENIRNWYAADYRLVRWCKDFKHSTSSGGR